MTLPVQRAVGPVTALLRTEFAGDAGHWAEALPLPQTFSFRVVHKLTLTLTLALALALALTLTLTLTLTRCTSG